jgi:hypothetical protein
MRTTGVIFTRLDASNPPVAVQTASGKQLLVVTLKDGHLDGFDLANIATINRC